MIGVLGAMCLNRPPYEYLQNVHSHEKRPLPLAFCRKLCYADCGATSSTPVGGSPGFLGGYTSLPPIERKGGYVHGFLA